MGISALPQATVRTLGASQVLTEPSALVKELIDNALDANATSISVEISANTVDVVQVRDNGHGVAPEDRPLVARRYCTSKISHNDDWKDIGRSSLGFRGEALASAAELSGSLTISTRVESEQVAAALKINKNGQVLSQEKASLPVGTTVRITDFTKANPVRRQVVLKNAESCLKKIRRTLQAYALARPHVRMSLKVLQAKDNKGGWVYAPKPNGSFEDAAFKVVGAACASQCIWSEVEDSGFAFQAFLPRSDANPSKIANHGAFISVDHRPVSATRGTFKQICKIFREHLKASSREMTDVKDPFLFLAMICPPRSYDANLEPAKDDVLFEDSSLVVEIARKLLTMVYTGGPVQQDVPETSTEAMPRGLIRPSLSTTSLEPPTRTPITEDWLRSSGERSKPAALPRMENDGELDIDDAFRTQRKPRSNMYGCDEVGLDVLGICPPTGHTKTDFEEIRQATKCVSVSSPWVMAKLNASSGRQMPAPITEGRPESQHGETLPNVLSSPMKQRQVSTGHDAPPTPRLSSPTPPAEPFHPSDHVPNVRLARDRGIIADSDLPPPQPYTPAQRVRLETNENSLLSSQRQLPVPYNYDPSSPAELPGSGTPLNAIPDTSRPRRSPRKQHQQSAIGRPFVSPVINQPPREKVWLDHPENLERPCDPRRHRQQKPQGDSDLIMQGKLGDLIHDPRPLATPRCNRDIRDFISQPHDDSMSAMIARRNYGRAVDAQASEQSRRECNDPKSLAFPKNHGFMSASELAALEARHGDVERLEKQSAKRRKTSERRPLRELSTNAPAAESEPEQETIDLTDGDDYRPRTSKRAASRRKSRIKSSRLPLKSTPAGRSVKGVSLSMHVDLRKIQDQAGRIDEDASILSYNEPALPAPLDLDAASSHLLTLTANLHKLLITAGGQTDAGNPAGLLKEMKAAFNARKEDEAYSSSLA